MRYQQLALALSALLAVALTSPVQQQQQQQLKLVQNQENTGPQNDVPGQVSNIENAVIRKLHARCASHEASACMKLKILAYMNKLMKKASIQFSEDIVLSESIVSHGTLMESSPRDISNVEGQDDDTTLFNLLSSKAEYFLRSKQLRWKLMPEADVVVSTSPDAKDPTDLSSLNVGLSVNTARAVETARLKLKTLSPLLAAGLTKIGLVAALKFFGLVALVFKAYVVSKLALVLALLIGLGRLLAGQQQHAVTYEVVTHPHHSSHSSIVGSSIGSSISSGDSHHDSYGSVGYGRSSDDLAYSAHAPASS